MRRRLVLAVLALFLVSNLFACTMFTKKEGASSAAKTSRASYYEFEDVLVPSEMKLDKKDSFIYTTSRFKAGVLTFTGRVEPDSLTAFFQNNMTKDGWRLISTFKFRETTLVFLKDERAAVVTIQEGLYNSKLQVRVGPTAEASGAPAKGSQPK